MFGAEGLLEEGKEHGDNDARFQTLSEADEEDLIDVSKEDVTHVVD